jgi:uncharacterized RmlC-like cupin family protein
MTRTRTRTISGKNLKIYFVSSGPSELTGVHEPDNVIPRFFVDGEEVSAATDLKLTLEPAHVSEAGSIINLVAGRTGSTSLIKSVRGAVRSNHYHLTDWHFLYVVNGLMYYYWRPHQETPPLHASPPLERIRCKPGDMMWTPPMVDHATYFSGETTLVAINGRPRDHNTHEEDVRRINSLISSTASLCPAVMNGVHCILPFENTQKSVGAHYHNGPHEDAQGNEFQF